MSCARSKVYVVCSLITLTYFQIFFQGIFTICDYCQQIETQKAITRKTAQQAMEVDSNADSDIVEASETVTFHT